MKAKTGFNRFVSIFLSVAIAISALAGLSLGGLMSVAVSAAELDKDEAMHFIVTQWHTTTQEGVYKNTKVTLEGYIQTEGSSHTLFVVDEYGYANEASFSDGTVAGWQTKATFDSVSGTLEIESGEYKDKDENKYEEYAGFSVSAGHTAIDIDDSDHTLTIDGSDENIHLVKSHVFYTNTSMYVAGATNKDLVSGSEEFTKDDRDTFYAYLDDESGKLIPVENSDTKTEGTKTVYDGADETTISKGAELTKYYNTADGLHTDKTAMKTAMEKLNDGRTFDLSLEAWFVGNKSANVGLVLDASGSMANPADDIDRINAADILGETTLDGTKITGTGILTAEAVDKILSKNKTDNSKLSAAGYSYYIFDPRSDTNEQIPIGYWDGVEMGAVERTVSGYKLPAHDSLIGYYGFPKQGIEATEGTGNSDIRDWGIEFAKDNTEGYNHAYTVKRQSSSGSINFIRGTEIESNKGQFGLHNFDTQFGYNVSYNKSVSEKSLGMLLAAHPSSGTFTLSFTVARKEKYANANADKNSNEIDELIYIGPMTATSSNEYYRIYRNSGSSRQRVRMALGTNEINTSDKSGSGGSNGKVLDKDKTAAYLTYVFDAENGKVTLYIDGNKHDEAKIENMPNSDINIILGGLKDNANGMDVYIDEVYVFDSALSESVVNSLYSFQSTNNISQSTYGNSSCVTPTKLNEEGDTITQLDDNCAKLSDGTVLASIGDGLPDGADADSIAKRAGWYYVSFLSRFNSNYFPSEIGTAKEFRYLQSAYKNVIGGSESSGTYTFCYDSKDHPDPDTDKDGAAAFTAKSYTTEDMENAISGWDSETSVQVVTGGKTNYKYSTVIYKNEDDENSPLQFFINEEGYLCCFFSTNNNPKADNMVDRCGWSYVYEKKDDQKIKQESLQEALGKFVVGFNERMPSGYLSATRFSLGKSYTAGENLTDDYLPSEDYLVLLDWTKDEIDANSMMNTLRGGKDKSYTYDKSEENGLYEYNYGLTGGTRTKTGLKAFIENLAKQEPEETGIDNEKYLIIFTDGKDSDLNDALKDTDSLKEAIQNTEAFKLAKELITTYNYHIYCVMLAAGTVAEGTDDYKQALKFLVSLAYANDEKTLTEEFYEDSNDVTIDDYDQIFIGSDSDELNEQFQKILDSISEDLKDYTVQDYIDPRFDLVDAEKNVWNLNADGAVTRGKVGEDSVSVTIYQKGTEATDPDSDGDTDVDGDGFIDKIQAAATKLDKKNYAIINLPNSNNEEGITAKLYFNDDTNMYYLVWDNQDIPSCVQGDESLKVWNATVTVRAKDDFIGGNAVTTNGNGADQNYVYMNGDDDRSSGTDRATVGYNPDDPTGESYPSKGFPRTTVNVAVPSLVLTGGEQVIYMGEELTPDGVAEKLGETILDKWEDTKDETGSDEDDRTQWYWEYLDRYANYATDEDGNKLFAKGLEDIIEKIVAAGENSDPDKKSIEYPYFYIPDPKNTNQTGSSEQHEKDQLGTLIFTWTTVDEGGFPYPDDGTTVDAEKRVSTLTVQYIPLQAEDRKRFINEYVQNEEVSGKDVYPWDSDYKPAPGQKTDKEEEVVEESEKEDHIPMESDSDKYNRLASEGSYKTTIVKGEIWLQVELDKDDIDYLKAHYPDDKKISYTIPLKRTYEGGITDVTVGNFKFTKQISELQTLETAKFTPDPKYTEMLEKYGLPIGSYTLGTPEPTEPYGFLQFGNPEVHVITSDDLILFTGYSTATGISLTEEEKVLNKAAPYEDGTIYLGYGSGKYLAEDREGTIYEKGDSIADADEGKDKSEVRRYTDDLLGMYIASPTLQKGNLSITKTVKDTATFTAQHEAYGDQTFTFEVTLEGVSGQFTLKHGDGTEKTIGTKDAAFTKVQVEVKTGETVTIEGIPAGTSYTVTEVTPPVGYTIDYADKLTVTGEIKATGEGTAEANFKNIYRADGTSVFEITKTLIGRKWADDETFTFVVKPYEDDDIDGTTDGETISTKDAIEKGYVAMPEGSDLGDGTYKIAVAKNETDNSSFTVETDPISFTKEGTYKFTVSEIREEDQLDDVIIDDNKYLLTVEVLDDGESNLTASNYAYETCDKMEDGGFPFVNTVSTQIDFDITKVLKGRDWKEGESFNVDIEYVPEESTKSYSGAEAPVIAPSSVTISDDDDEHTKTATITFYSVGKYTFTVKEANGTDSNMLYDEEYKDGHTVIVEVDQDDDGLYVKSVQIDKNDPVSNPSSADITITNEYTVTTDVSIDIPVTKTFAYGKWIDGTYSFDIDFDDSVSKEDRDKITFSNKTITIEKEGKSPNFGTISFKNIVLEEDHINGGYSKTFKFVVKEQNGGKKIDGITYDDTVYNVAVTITDDGTEPTVTVTKVVGTDEDEAKEMSFENEYSAAPAEWMPKVQKTFTGRAWLSTDEFTFTITQDKRDTVQITPLPSSITIGKDTPDDHTASFGAITFNTEGTYNFTISEEKPTAKGITKETSDYKVKVVVTDNYLKGQLEYTVTYTDSESKDVKVTDDPFEFTNTYTPEPVTWTPSIEKQINDTEGTGRDKNWIGSDSFTFEITLDSPKGDTSVTMPVPNTVTIDSKTAPKVGDEKTRSKSFGEITFTKAGDYTFTIKENGESKDGIILDTHRSYKVTVTVSDDSEGTLSITNIAYEDRDKKHVDQTTGTNSTAFLFINTHEHEAVHWYPTVSKDIYGRDWISGDEFGFTIKLADGQEESIVNNVNMPSTNVATVTKENTPTDFKDITFTEIGVYKFIVKENDLTESNGLAKDETKYTVTVTVANKPNTEDKLIITEVEVYNSKTEKTKTYTTPEEVNVNFEFTNIYSASGTIDIPVSKVLNGRAWTDDDSFTFTISPDTYMSEGSDDTITITNKSEEYSEGDIKGYKGFFNLTFGLDDVGKTFTFTIKESQESTIDHITYSEEVYTVEVTVKDQGDGTLDTKITKVTEAKDPTKDGVVFTNTYTPEPVTWTPYVSKTIVDEDDPTRGENWLTEAGKDTFKFTVSIAGGKNYGDNVVMPENAEVEVNYKNHDKPVPFDAIEFTKGGTYEFVIKETEENQDGIIYDHTEYNVTVVVSDDTNGKLSIASVKYEDREGTSQTVTGNDVKNVTFPFVNKHHHDAVKLDLSAKKKLTGRDWHGDEFTFTVTQDSSDTFKAHMSTTNTATVSGPNAVEFSSDITFTEVGEYHFTVKENELSDDVKKYITPVDSEHEVYVKIDDYEGKLYISEMKIGNEEVTNLPEPSDTDFETKRPTISHVLEFENKYSAEPAQIQIPVSKVLDGREWTADDSFTFTISPDTYSSTNTITITNKSEGHKGFFDLTFDLEDIEEVNEFTFTISENSDSPIDHITYSDEEYTVTVEVTDNYKGELTAEITKVTNKAGEDVTALGNGIIFTNTYMPDPATWTPSVTKEISGRSEWNPNYSFGFTITPESTDGIYYEDSDGNEQPYPAKDSVTISSETSHTESFKTVIFKKADTYTFTVKETVPAEAENNQLNGITYDGKDHTVVVTVDDTDGQLEISAITVDGKDVTKEGTDTTKVNIINTYSANGSWPPVVEKSFDTRNWDDSDNGKYTFVLSLEEPVDTSAVTIPNAITISGGNAGAKSVTETFDEVKFTESGTYKFKLTEETYNDRGVTSAETVYNITVEVTDKEGDGKLTTVSAVTKDGEEYNGTNYAFENTYTPEPATWTPSVQKKLEGADWNDYTFTFSITPKGDYGDAVEMTDTTIDISDDNAPDYTAQFGMITFTKAGTYVFTIAEVDTGIDNIVYDGTPRFVTVKVVDDPVEGKLKIDPDSITVNAGTNSYTLNEGDNISFTNYYTENAIVKNAIKVEKKLDTVNGRDWLNSDTFSFRLALDKGKTLPEYVNNVVMKVDDKQVDELTAVISGSDDPKSAVFSDIEFTAEGTYVFTVSEIIPDGATVNVYQGVTYDVKPYEVTVVVTLEEEIIDDTDPDNIVKEYHLVAEVQDNDGVDDGIVTFSFTNTAVPATLAEASINVKKTLDGKEDDWGSDSFSFKIEPDDDYGEDVVMPENNVISISADTPAHTAYFDKIIFNTIGEYHFTVSEVLPEGVDSNNNTLDNITYDVNTHEVVVKVYVDENNELAATIQGENDVALSNVTVEFTNKYTSPSTPTPPSTNPPPVTNPTPSTPTQPSENTTSEDTSAPEQTTGPEETTPEETTSEATTASSEESTVPSEETTPDTTDSEEVSENDGYNTNVDGDGDKNMNTGVPFGSAIMMCALSSLAVAVAVRKKKNGRNDK